MVTLLSEGCDKMGCMEIEITFLKDGALDSLGKVEFRGGLGDVPSVGDEARFVAFNGSLMEGIVSERCVDLSFIVVARKNAELPAICVRLILLEVTDISVELHSCASAKLPPRVGDPLS